MAWLCALLGLGLVGLPGLARAQAQDAPGAVIVRVPGDEEIVLRLRAELSGYRFHVAELPDRPARRSEPLSQLAEQREAQAVLRAKPDIMAVELWVRVAGASSPSQELVNAGPGHDAEVLAMRVTEAMRARGLAPLQLSAATGRAPGPAAEGGKPSSSASTPDAAVGGSEPRSVQPAETTEPVSKPAEAGKPAPSPPATKPAASPTAKPEKPAETEQAPPNTSPKPGTTRSEQPTSAAAAPKPADEEAKQPATVPKPAQTAEPQPQPEQSPVVADAVFAGARNALLYAEIGPAGVLSPGPNRLGPALDLLVSFTFRPYQTSSISLVGLIPLLSKDLVGNGASVDVRTYGIGGFGDLHLPLGRFELSAGLGALALISTVLVMPEQGLAMFMSDYPTQRLAALLGRVGASLALTRDLNVRASVMVGLTVQPLQLQFPRTAGAEAGASPDATWGSPLLFGSLSIELALPWDR